MDYGYILSNIFLLNVMHACSYFQTDNPALILITVTYSMKLAGNYTFYERQIEDYQLFGSS